MRDDPRDPREPFDFDEEEEEPRLERRLPNPPRPDPPIFAPVVFDDDEEERPRRPFRTGRDESDGEYASDAGLLRVLGIIVVLGLVIIALVLPWSPISVVGGDDDGGGADGITAEARDDLPPLPDGLVALSRLYDISVQEGISGPLRVEIRLTETTEDASNLAYYSWSGDTWSRIGGVEIKEGGGSVTGTIPATSGSIAVLRRTALAFHLGLVVDAGETPDPAGLTSADTVAVMAGALPEGDEAEGLQVVDVALRAADQVAGDRPVLFGISGNASRAGVYASDEAVSAHIEEVVAAARGQNADGVLIEYTGVAASEGPAFTGLVTQLAERLEQETMTLVVVVPASGEGYQWAAIQGVADALWVRAPLDPVTYYQSVGTLLGMPQSSGVNAANVSLVLDRRSALTGAGDAQPLTLVQALTVASTVDYNVEAIGPGSPVTLRTAYLGPGAEGLHWDNGARSVAFSYVDDGAERTLFLQNSYSLAFQLEAARAAGFGGVAIASASDTAAHPDVWETVAQFVSEGALSLETPFGPYLTPCWEADDGTIEGQPECWTEQTDTSAVVWRAPDEEGAYTVRLVVSEGTLFVAQEIALRVGEEPEETAEPTDEPTEAPTEVPTEVPTAVPTEVPTEAPTETPTGEATEEPTETPTAEPTQTAPPGPGGNG